MRGVVLGLSLGAMFAMAAACSAQVVFTYSASDFHSFTLNPGGAVTIPVSTVVVIQGDPAPGVSVPTQTFQFHFRPPAAEAPQLLQADVNNRGVKLNVLRTDLDGNMQGTVEVPVTAGLSPELKIFWNTADAGPMVTTIHPTLMPEASAPKISVVPGVSAKPKPRAPKRR